MPHNPEPEDATTATLVGFGWGPWFLLPRVAAVAGGSWYLVPTALGLVGVDSDVLLIAGLQTLAATALVWLGLRCHSRPLIYPTVLAFLQLICGSLALDSIYNLLHLVPTRTGFWYGLWVFAALAGLNLLAGFTLLSGTASRLRVLAAQIEEQDESAFERDPDDRRVLWTALWIAAAAGAGFSMGML